MHRSVAGDDLQRALLTTPLAPTFSMPLWTEAYLSLCPALLVGVSGSGSSLPVAEEGVALRQSGTNNVASPIVPSCEHSYIAVALARSGHLSCVGLVRRRVKRGRLADGRFRGTRPLPEPFRFALKFPRVPNACRDNSVVLFSRLEFDHGDARISIAFYENEAAVMAFSYFCPSCGYIAREIKPVSIS